MPITACTGCHEVLDSTPDVDGARVDATCDECAELLRLRARVAELEGAQARHLALIAELSRSAIDESEAEEMRAQIAALIAEVGTLRATLRGQALGGEVES